MSEDRYNVWAGNRELAQKGVNGQYDPQPVLSSVNLETAMAFITGHALIGKEEDRNYIIRLITDSEKVCSAKNLEG